MDSNNLPSLREELSFHIDESTLPVRADQIRTRLDAYPVMLASQAFLAPTLVWMMSSVVPTWILLSWLVLVLTTVVFDAWYFVRHQTEIQTVEQCRRWSRHFVWFVVLLGALWGAAGVVMFVPDNLGYQSLLICVALGLAAGAVTINPVYVPALFIWTILVLTPIIVMVFAVDDEVHMALGAMLLLYSATVLNDGYKLSRRLMQALLRGYENTSLLKDLSNEKVVSELAREKAEAANKEKSRFLASASHDLRQPLQAMLLFSDALNNHVRGHDPVAEKLAGQIESAVSSLSEMLSSLLNISRMESGYIQPQFEHFNVFSLLDRLYLEFYHLAQEKGLNFSIPVRDAVAGHWVVYSDPHLLEQFIRNLASNAIRYTDQGEVEVACNLVGDRVEISVNDTGIGISQQDLPHIFDEYFQAGNPQRDRRQGLGLGLSIVRRVEKLLDYHVSVNSILRVGTNFRFLIPLGDPDQESFPYRFAEAEEDIFAIKVALLEDDAEIRIAMHELLESWGCHVIAGELPEAVIAAYAATQQQPDIILSDYRLPAGKTAIDAINQMRTLWGATLPAIVVTGDTGGAALHAIQSVGAVLANKPISPSRLRGVIHRTMHER